MDFIADLLAEDPNIAEYMFNATNGEKYDFNDFGKENITDADTPQQHRYRESVDLNDSF